LDNVDTRKKIVAESRNKVAAATLRATNAQSSFNAADAAWKQAISDLEMSKNILSSAQSALNAAQQNLQLALTEQGQAAKTLAAARKAVEDAQTRFNAASKAVSDAEDNLVKAKAAFSAAEQALTDAKTLRDAAEKEYQRAYDALEAAKTQLEDARARKAQADQVVKAAQDALEIATQARDDADSALKQADFNLANAEKVLDAALRKVAAIREKFNAAKNELSAAQWDWELVLNKLYVAQSRKETADRATAIALAEGSLSDHNVNNGVSSIGGSINLANGGNVSFGGCDARSYPVISGNSQVVSVSSNGYRLASGHNVIYGSCSNAAKCSVGDFVNYNGYIVNGVVNAMRIERVLLS
jgi:chromosome segregation ATPase